MCSRKYKEINLCRISTLRSKEVAYFLGVMATDGNLYICKNGSERLSIFVQEKDRDWLIKVRNIFTDENPIKVRKVKKSRYVGFSITQKGLADALDVHGIIENKSHTIKFPKKMPKKLLPHFIRGCFDGDGSITFKRSEARQAYIQTVKFISGSKEFLEGLQEVLSKKGINTSLCTEKRKKPRQDLHRLHIMKDSLGKMYDYMYKDSKTCLLRKKKIFKKLLKYREKYKNGVQERHRRLNKILTKSYFKKSRSKITGKVQVRSIARRLKVDKSTVYRHMKKLGVT